MNVRLSGTFTLRSPLSHIGESISTTSYLVQDPILQADGSVEQVFCYSGNAWRGQLRDLAAVDMLERIGSPKLGLDAFHLLFSGGRIGGAQVTDLEKARKMRRAIPMLALFGGGVGNQILSGKMRVGNCYPVCAETVPVLPSELRAIASRTRYRDITFEKSFSRRDDGKIEGLRGFLQPENVSEDDGSSAGKKTQKRGKEASDVDVADQMRMTCELVAPGTMLHTRIDLLDVSEIEFGAIVSSIVRFSTSPHIGGQANKGHGLVDLRYDIVPSQCHDGEHISVFDSVVSHGAYCSKCVSAYQECLNLNAATIKKLLEAA